jgi:hypothetical protein
MNEVLLKWIRQKGYGFKEGDTDFYDGVMRVITCNRRLSEEKKLYSVLHECGHLLVQRDTESYEKRYKSQVEGLFDKRKCRSLRWRIDFLKEEYDAWDRGFRLAGRLKIPIDEDSYYKYASKCLETYCKWVVDKEWHRYDY